jgi:hypothetical protein
VCGRSLTGASVRRGSVKAKLDARAYPRGVKVLGAEMDALFLVRDALHGDRNYSIHEDHQSRLQLAAGRLRAVLAAEPGEGSAA